MNAIGVFGGAYAPFHTGHLRVAIEAREQLGLSALHLIPTAQAPHRRNSHVAPQRRLRWIELATHEEPGLLADDRELRRTGPSFTVDTLAELRTLHPQSPLVLLMGGDAFQHLHTWHRWRELVELAHLVVVTRPGTVPAPNAETQPLLDGRLAHAAAELQRSPAGRWMRLELPMLDISSTRIRRLLAAGRSVRGLVPDAILRDMTAADIAALIQDEDATTH